jgi:hypothetical protein
VYRLASEASVCIMVLIEIGPGTTSFARCELEARTDCLPKTPDLHSLSSSRVPLLRGSHPIRDHEDFYDESIIMF